MKKNNLKRFLASLLAVLMLASVTGVSPAVFADNSATPELKSSSGEIIIRSGMDDALVTETLNKALINNYDQLDDTTKASLQWEYLGYGYTDKIGAQSVDKHWGSISGGTKFTERHVITYTYYNKPLAELEPNSYQVRLAGKTTEATLVKVDKYSGASITLTDYENGIKVPYNNDGSINYAQLKERILNKVVTNPVDVDRSSITIEYPASPDLSKLGENPALDKITELAGTKWTPIEGGSHEFIGISVPYFAMTAGENKIKLTWGGNDTYKGCSSDEFPVNFLDREPAPLQRNDVSEIGIVYNDDLSVNYEATKEVIRNTLATSTNTEIVKTSDLKVEYQTATNFEDFGSDANIKPGTEKTIRLSWNGNADYRAWSEPFTVTFVDGRDPAFKLKDGVKDTAPEIGLVFKYDEENGVAIDYVAAETAIREALVEKLANVDLADISVQYEATPGIFKPISYDPISDKNAFGEGTEKIKLTWGGNKDYRSFSETVNVKMVDNRIASEIKVVSDPSITYNMNASEMEKAIFNSVINWDASELPAKDTLTADSFVIEYYATAQFEAGDTTTKLPDDIAHAWVPIGGLSKTVDLSFIGLGKIGIVYPQMGAGEQQIRIRFIGSADYKPSEVEAALSVAKADVKVNVKRPVIIMHAGDKDLPEGSITLTPDDKSIDVYTVFAGITSKIGGKVTTSVYLDLPDRYTTDNKLLTKVLDPLFESVIGRTFTDVLQEGITVGELKQLAAKASEVADKLGKIGIDVESFTKLMDTIANLPGIVDDMRIAIGTPNHAGIYQAFVITNNVNYNTAYGTGTVLVLKQFNGISLVKNSAFDANGGKITVSQAKEIANSVCILSNDDGPLDNEAQGAIRYLFTGIKSSHGLYSNSKMPVEPGRYIVTATVVGGDFFAFPKTFSFTIVADPTSNT